MTKDLSCPSCASDATQKLSLVFEHGYSDINTKSGSIGLGLSGDGFGLGGAKTRTKGVSQTAASQKAAPPLKKTYLKPLLMIFGAYVVASIFLRPHGLVGQIFPLLWIGGSIAWIVHAFKFNSNVWPELLAAWDKTFVCNRCSHTFQI